MAKGLKPVQRVKKKEIKEDKLVTTYFQSRKYFEKNQKKILQIVGGALLLIVIIVFWINSRKGAEYDAAYELGVAMAQATQAPPQALADEFLTVADRFPGTTAANEALMYSAQMLRQTGKNEEALEAYENYLSKGSKDKFLYPAALAGKAACLEDMDRFEEAALAYMQAASARQHYFLAPQFLLDAARCYKLAGNTDEARTQYEFVLANYPDTDFATTADNELKRI